LWRGPKSAGTIAMNVKLPEPARFTPHSKLVVLWSSAGESTDADAAHSSIIYVANKAVRKRPNKVLFAALIALQRSPQPLSRSFGE
jgi:hypothetical protein